MGILVGIMVLLGIFALIFSATRTKENLGADTEELNAGGTINGDKGYISSAQIIQTKTGTGPWDADDEPGNDSSEDNNIVRSFDQVTWTIDLTFGLKSGTAESSLTGGTINVEATLPEECSNVMKWNLESMQWIEDGEISSDGRTLTGKYSMSEKETTIPGKQTLVFVLGVEGAGNGTKITPTFNFSLEGNETSEKVVLTGETILVSAKGKYNIKLVRNAYLNKRALNLQYNEESIDGRVYGYAFILQLYNDNPSKGMKGIDYPKGEITFDLNMTLQRSKFESTELEDITDISTPILWNYAINNSGNPVISTRSMDFGGGNWTARWYAPSGINNNDRLGCVYNSGNIQMEQNGGTIQVSIKDYDFDGIFPKYTKEYTYMSGIVYPENIGCFSVGYFQVIVPDTDETKIENRNYYLTMEDSNLNVNTLTGTNVTNQMITNDDVDTLTHVRYQSGGFSHYIYLYDSNYAFLHSTFAEGDSKANIGQEFWARSYVGIDPNNDPDDRIKTVDRFFKFDGEAFEIQNYVESNQIKTMTWKYWYVTKKDGSNWASQTEMNNGNIEDMLLYENKESIPEGNICIGIYIESQTGYLDVPRDNDTRYFDIKLKVKDTAKINKTYGMTQTSKYWKEELDRSIYSQSIKQSYDTYPTPILDFCNRQYIKTEYDENGNIVSGTHSGGQIYGQTVLIIGANLHGSINTIDSDNKEKVNYDLGKNENVVTYSVKPQLDGNSNLSSQIDNVTLKAEVTLPQGLTYIPGSSNYGEADIIANSDGSQSLTWYIYGCTSGQTIEPIAFNAQIDNETVNGTQYETKFVVSEVIGTDGTSKIGNTRVDFRTSTDTISVINLASHRLYKEIETQIIEKNGQIKYKITYVNNTEEAVPTFQLLDILPYNGDGRGTSYLGTYTLANVNVSETVNGVPVETSNLALYTTTSATVRDMDSKNTGIGVASIWSAKTMGAMLNESATGFALKGELAGKTKLEIEVTLNTNGNAAENVYANNTMAQVHADSEQMQTGAVKAQVVSRKIQGKVWEDSNRNGVIDSSEKYLEGTVVKLLSSVSGAEVTRTTTNAQGEYEFTNLAKGTYKVEVETDDLHELTEKEIGTNREINSKFNQVSKQTDNITKLNSISAPELIEENVNAGIRKIQFNINTKVEGTGGNVSGEEDDIYESVDKGENSAKDIVVTPLTGYRVESITVNGELISFSEEANHTVILNKFINMQEHKEVVVTFKDVRTSVLVHYYKEGTSERLSEDVTINGEIGDSYTTQVASDIPKNYELVNTPTNVSGTMVASQTVVTYYYRLKTPTVSLQNITKTATPTIENLTDKITYNISYKVSLVDYIGEAEVTIIDKLPYQIVVANSDLAGGTYDSQNNTITWVENIGNIDTYTNSNSDITINKTIKVVYTGINQETTNIENRVTGSIKTKTPAKEFEEVEATADTRTEFTVNIPVSKIWEDESDKLGQRPTRVMFKLHGSDGSEYTKELAKPGT